MHFDTDSENLCRSGYDVRSGYGYGFDFVSMGDPGCSGDAEESKWIAYEGSLPTDSGISGSIPTGWCVLENYKYKEQYRLLKTVGFKANNSVLIPPQRLRGDPEATSKHFKAIPHGKGQVTILNAMMNQILEMRLSNVKSTRIWTVGAIMPSGMCLIGSKCAFTVKEVDDGPGKVTSILDIST